MMWGPAGRRVAAAAVALLLLAGCSGGSTGQAQPGATVGTEPPRTTTTDPYAVPEVIDEAYVNRVLAGLDAVDGDVIRMVVESRTIPPLAIEKLRALYLTDRRLQLDIDVLQEDMRLGFKGFKPNPGNAVTTVEQLLIATPRCIFARVSRDFTSVATDSAAPTPWWVTLMPIDRSRDPQGFNPTPWMYAFNGFTSDGATPQGQCA